jgi:uncharacterized protein (DUF305 family)
MSPVMVRKHYSMLALNMAINLAIMYLVMFAMIYRRGEFVQNLNFFYMALMMWAPMGALMLLFMGMMYRSKTLNIIIYASSVLIFVLAFIAIRTQTLVGDRQFLRSMIPHHSGALVMCRQASIRDPQLKQLCFGPNGIVESQEREIELMTKILERQ